MSNFGMHMEAFSSYFFYYDGLQEMSLKIFSKKKLLTIDFF
jgi:hypothetical protein